MFASSQHLSTQFSACPSMPLDHATVFPGGFFPPWYSAVASAEIRDSNMFLHSSIMIRSACIHVECIPNIRGQVMKLVHQDQHSSSISSTCEPCSASFQPSWYHTRIPIRITPCFRWTNSHSQFGIVSHHSPNKTSSNCLSHSSLADGWQYKFRSRGTIGSSMLLKVIIVSNRRYQLSYARATLRSARMLLGVQAQSAITRPCSFHDMNSATMLKSQEACPPTRRLEPRIRARSSTSWEVCHWILTTLGEWPKKGTKSNSTLCESDKTLITPCAETPNATAYHDADTKALSNHVWCSVPRIADIHILSVRAGNTWPEKSMVRCTSPLNETKNVQTTSRISMWVLFLSGTRDGKSQPWFQPDFLDIRTCSLEPLEQVHTAGMKPPRVNFIRSPGTRFLDSLFNHSPLRFTLVTSRWSDSTCKLGSSRTVMIRSSCNGTVSGFKHWKHRLAELHDWSTFASST